MISKCFLATLPISVNFKYPTIMTIDFLTLTESKRTDAMKIKLILRRTNRRFLSNNSIVSVMKMECCGDSLRESRQRMTRVGRCVTMQVQRRLVRLSEVSSLNPFSGCIWLSKLYLGIY